jgi:DNA processing protein
MTPRSSKIPPGALPSSEADARDWLRLTRARRVGPATFIRLLRELGSAREALRVLPRVASDAGVHDYALPAESEIDAEWLAAMDAGARPLLLGADDYPALLATIGDPPPLLWAKGDPEIGHRPSVALVGARNASALGCRMAARLAQGLGAASLAVTSGLARGVDAAAHEASLPTGAVAVLAGGLDVVFPPENAGLAERIAASGLLVTEMPMGHPPRAQDFPRRNRIVSGLSLGVVVIEGAERSGSLITARNALDQGREVMAVPGNPLDARAGGCNQLIRDGATLVRSAADVLEALAATLDGYALRPGRPAPSGPVAPSPAPIPAEGLRGRLIDLLGPSPTQEDALIRETRASPSAVAAALLELELEGRIARHPGGLVSRPPD